MNERILIAYASKCGSTGEVAEAIGQELSQSGALVDVCPAKDVTEISPYDAVMVGSPIFYTKWRSEATRFVERCVP